MNCHEPMGLGSTPQQARFALKRAFVHAQLTFVAPESNFRNWEEDKPPQFELDLFSFTALREPRARWISQYHQKVRFNPDLGRTMGLNETAWFKACYKEASTPRECNHLVTFADFLGWMQEGGGYIINGKGHNDNFMARYLLGLKRDFFSGAPRPLGADDLVAAMRALDEA